MNRRHTDFIKDQKLQLAENAIADQYGNSMLQGINVKGGYNTNNDHEGMSGMS